MTQLNTILLVFIGAYLACETCLLVLNGLHVQKHAHFSETFREVMEESVFDKTIAYTLVKNQFAIWELFYNTAVLCFVLFSGLLTKFYYTFCTGDLTIWQEATCVFVWTTLIGLFSWPLDYWYTFSIEKNFGFNRSSVKLWLLDHLKEMIVGAIIYIPILAILFWVIHCCPKTWWIWGACGSLLLQIVLIWLYPKLIVPLFNKLTPLPEGSLKERLNQLARKAGFKAAAIQVLDSSKRSTHSNAYCSSLGKIQHIVLYDTLLEGFTEEEIEAILAHEIGHYKHKHILKTLLFSTLTTLGFFKLCDVLYKSDWLYQQFGIENTVSPLLLLLLITLTSHIFTYWFNPISNWFSRRYEYEADAYTKNFSESCSKNLIVALKKLYRENLSNLLPHPWYIFFHYSHPTLWEREKHLLK